MTLILERGKSSGKNIALFVAKYLHEVLLRILQPAGGVGVFRRGLRLCHSICSVCVGLQVGCHALGWGRDDQHNVFMNRLCRFALSGWDCR